MSTERSDKTSVIFKKFEKVGEPYKFQKRTIQTYKLYTEPFISVDMDFIWAYVKGSNTIDIIIKKDIEDMEENKLNLKPFDIQKAKDGKPVCTRDGRKARIICFDKKCLHEQVLIALVDHGKEESIYFYTTDGKCIDDFSSFDLMMLPEKKSGWINIKKDESLFKSREEAERDCTEGYAAVMVEFEI